MDLKDSDCLNRGSEIVSEGLVLGVAIAARPPAPGATRAGSEPPPPQVPYTAHWLRRVMHPRYASAAAAAAGEVGQIFGSTRALFSPF